MKELIKQLEAALTNANHACKQAEDLLFSGNYKNTCNAVRDGIIEALATAKAIAAVPAPQPTNPTPPA